jgi:protein-tyrosine phosphatase
VDPDEIVGSTPRAANIIVARQEHIPEVLRMLSAGFHRAAALGYEQWWDPFPAAIVEDSVFRRETYVAVKKGIILGTLALSWEDPMFWGPRPPDSGYVHRLCTNPDVACQGFGVELLTWADTETKSRGRGYLRLDTPASNARLRAYYESLRFLFQGERDVTLVGVTGETEIWRAALYERRTLPHR